MNTTLNTETASPSLIYPPHEVRDRAKLAALTEAMRRDGWTGRPLLVVLDGDTRRAITGSHRIEAAIAAELDEVPVVFVDGSVVVLDGDYEGEFVVDAIFGGGGFDQERAESVLRAAGCDEAADLMAEEIAANDTGL